MRWSGLPAMMLGFALWQGAARPDLLIADTGTLVGLMTPDGRALSKAKGAGFVARNWLENDGTGGTQQGAAKLWKKGAIVHLSGKRALAGFQGCTSGQIIVASAKADILSEQPCMVFDPVSLKQTGAVALRKSDRGWQITTAREIAGDRLWTNWPKAAPTDQYVRISPTKRP